VLIGRKVRELRRSSAFLDVCCLTFLEATSRHLGRALDRWLGSAAEMSPFWIYTQLAIVIMVLAGAIIALTKLL
jgi:hypothetical protein